MKLLIDIPKEFEQHFKTDGFKDSLYRLSADAHLLAGNYEQETAVMLIETFASAVPISPHCILIDADSKTFPTFHRNPSNDYMKGWNACLRSVQQQPTIIPAELSKEET